MASVATGLCYTGAVNHVTDAEVGTLVHGSVWSPNLRRRIGHAWVEDGNFVYDYETLGQMRTYDRDWFYEEAQAQVHGRWTPEQAMKMRLRQGHTGPWVDEHGRSTPRKTAAERRRERADVGALAAYVARLTR